MGNALSPTTASGHSNVLSLTHHDLALKRLNAYQQQQQHRQSVTESNGNKKQRNGNDGDDASSNSNIGNTTHANGNGQSNSNKRMSSFAASFFSNQMKKDDLISGILSPTVTYKSKLEDAYQRLAQLSQIQYFQTSSMGINGNSNNSNHSMASLNADSYYYNNNGVTEAGFVDIGIKEIFPNMPPILASRLYRAFSGNSGSVTSSYNTQSITRARNLYKEEFIVLLIILALSTFEERVLIAYSMMDTRSLGFVTSDDMVLLLNIIHGSSSYDDMDPGTRMLSLECLNTVFPSSSAPDSTISYQEFSDLSGKYFGASLFSWIPWVGQGIRFPVSLSSERFDKAIEKLESELHSDLANNEIEIASNHHYDDNNGDDYLEMFGTVKILKPKHEAALFRRYYKDPLPENLALGEQWYLIHAKWFYYWSKYTGYKDKLVQKPAYLSTPDKFEGLSPGRISNQILLEKTPNGLLRLRRNIKPFVDYWLIPMKCWLILSQWHGFDYSIFRTVVPDGSASSSIPHTPKVSSAPSTDDEDNVEYAKIEGPLPLPPQRLRIEMYPLTLIVEYKPKRNITESSNGSWNISKSIPWNWGSNNNSSEIQKIEKTILLSRSATLRELRKYVCQVHGIPNTINSTQMSNNIEFGHVQLYKFSRVISNMHSSQSATSLSSMGSTNTSSSSASPAIGGQSNKNGQSFITLPLIKNDDDLLLTLEEAGVIDGERLLVDVQTGEDDEDEEVQMSKDNGGSGTPSSNGSVNHQRKRSTLASSGLIGLQNLGNTCFINSPIQCLSHTKILRNYFVTGQYMNDINTTSVNGSQGKLAEAFGSLLKELWTSYDVSVAPKNFKAALAAIDEQYNGYNQHDAQEMLARLLDCLSEDLNKVLKKPYVEQPDSAGRDDKVVAAEWWENHLQRERSIVSSLFTGQFKSSIHCLACNFDSSRFEPFMSLSLPLPETRVRMLTIILVPLKGKENIECAVRVPIISTVLDVKRQLRLLKFDNFESAATTNFEEDWISAKMSYDYSCVAEYIPDDKSVGLIDVDEVIFMFEQLPKAKLDDGDFRIGERVIIKTTATPSESKPPEEENNHNESNQIDEAEEQKLSIIIGKQGSLTTPKSYSSTDSISTLLNGNGHQEGDDVESIATIASARSEWKYDVMHLTFPISKDSLIPEASLQKLDASKQYITFRVIQRQWVRNKYYFLNPYVPVNCGDSFCIRINPDITTSCDLYAAIDDRLGIKGKMAINSKDGTSYHSPYQIRIVKLNSTSPSDFSCPKCHWTKACRGCPLSCNDTPLSISYYLTSSELLLMIDWGISIPFEDESDIMNQCSRRKLVRHESIKECLEADNESTTLSECFKTFTSSERMEGANECYCSQCKKFQPHLKNLSLWRAPPILIVHLKRFHHTELGGRKLTRLVDFPLDQLDLLPFTSSTSDQIKSKYKLYAVINHSGNLGGGHYTAIVRQPYTRTSSLNVSESSDDNNNGSPSMNSNSKWTYFDDGRVIPCPIDVVSKHAYILFYINEDYENAESVEI